MLDKISVVTTAINEQVKEDGRRLEPFKTMAELRYNESALRTCLRKGPRAVGFRRTCEGAPAQVLRGKPYDFHFDRREFPNAYKHCGSTPGIAGASTRRWLYKKTTDKASHDMPMRATRACRAARNLVTDEEAKRRARQHCKVLSGTPYRSVIHWTYSMCGPTRRRCARARERRERPLVRRFTVSARWQASISSYRRGVISSTCAPTCS